MAWKTPVVFQAVEFIYRGAALVLTLVKVRFTFRRKRVGSALAVRCEVASMNAAAMNEALA